MEANSIQGQVEEKSRSSGSETLAYLKEKMEKRNKVKRTRARTDKIELELQESRLQIVQDQQNQLLTNLMAQNNQLLAVISNITGKKANFRERNFIFCFLYFVNS